MYCQLCGKPVAENAIHCSHCGAHIPIEQRTLPWAAVFLVLSFAIGVIGISLLRQPAGAVDGTDLVAAATIPTDEELTPVAQPGLLPDSYQLTARFGDLGPRLLAAGAIDLDKFDQIYEGADQPLSETQLATLTQGSDEAITFDHHNAYFLLNFFWAVGLTNENRLLDKGPMVEYSQGEIGRYASTGGWTIGQKPATELYSSAKLISLTDEQHAHVEEVARGVFRPCCNNHTAFPDCNHGMAMLGLLQVMAAQGATVDDMFEAAKVVNAFWFPQQAQEAAIFFKTSMNLDYADVPARMAVGPEVFSGSGFEQMHQWLISKGGLEQPSQGGNSSCGV